MSESQPPLWTGERPDVCSEGGCAAETMPAGLCRRHYMRRWRAEKAASTQCAIKGCDRGSYVNGKCGVHYYRMREHGDPDLMRCQRCREVMPEVWFQRDRTKASGRKGVCLPCGREIARAKYQPAAPRVVTTYAGAHARVTAKYGPARNYPCQYCVDQAEQWAYGYSDPDELQGYAKPGQRSGFRRPLLFSTDPSHYLALCRGCHTRLDKSARRLRIDPLEVITLGVWTAYSPDAPMWLRQEMRDMARGA